LRAEAVVSRVAIVIPGLDRIGGAERQAMLLAKGMRLRSWQVDVVALSGIGGKAADELREAGVDFVTFKMRKGLADPRGWVRLNRWLRQERPDLVHAHLPHAAWMARWSRLAAPAPVVIDTLHSSFAGGKGRRFGYRCSDWLTDQVTAVSQATAAAHLAAGMISPRRLTIVPNGIDVDAWRPDAGARGEMRRGLGIGGEFLWLAAGRLEEVKDFPTLLRAMARLPEHSHLVVLGDGPQKTALMQLAACIGLERRVHFTGFVPDVKRWMEAADGFVLSSRYEGLPMALLEAGACGVPAVATDVAGTREVIVNGENGLLAQAGNAEALADAMTMLIRMPAEQRCAMGERAREHVLENFSLDAVLDQWERLYAKLLARNGDRATRRTARETLMRDRLISAQMRSTRVKLVGGYSASTRSTEVN
jgi:glycosyltransferase involved in cell wall biosynthesis